MTPSSKIVKKTAVTSLSGEHLNAFLCCCAVLSVVVINLLTVGVLASVLPAAFVAMFEFLFFAFITVPMIFGAFRFFKHTVWEENATLSDLFFAFKDKKTYIRFLLAGLYIYLRFVFSLLLFLIPSGIAMILNEPAFYQSINLDMPAFAPILSVVAVILLIAGIIMAIIINFKYYLMPYLLVSNDDISVGEAALLSKRMARVSLPEFLWLCLGHMGWIVLSVLIIPLPFTLPYFFSCYTVHCRFCVTDYNMTVTAAVNSSAPSFNPKF